MRKVLLAVMLLLVTASLFAQSLSVSGFRLLETDITAITQGTQEIDQNGEVAALIKVVTRETGFTFDIGALGVVGTRQAVGEIWVYVPKRAQKISIFHQQYGILRNYYFPVPIESGRTYELKLEVQKEEPQVIEKIVEKTVALSNEEGFYKSNLALAETGDAAAQYYVGYALYNGKGIAQNYEEAVEWFRKAANQNEHRAQYYLGLCYENGTGIEKDESEAFKFYNKAGSTQPQAAYRLAECLYQGKGVKKDVTKAFQCYQMASDKNVPEAMYKLGKMYYNGEVVKRNYKEAFNWYNKAAEAGYMDAMCALADCYKLGNGVKVNMDEAINWYGKALKEDEKKTLTCLGIKDDVSDETRKEIRLALDSAMQGSAKAQYYVGKLFYEEKDAARDNALAQYWLDKAAWEGNYIDAQILLGDYYVVIDGEEAFNWYGSAANQGNAEALCRLGNCYLQGIGVKKDYESGIKYYEQAVEKGNADAMWQLGECYRLGKGVKKNQGKAQEWYEKAAEQGSMKAQLFLAESYMSGKGVKKNETEAIKWYEKAGESGNVEAQLIVARYYLRQEDAEKTFKWYKKAAETGRGDICLYVGKCYMDGFGVEQDKNEAERWLSEAEEKYVSSPKSYDVKTMVTVALGFLEGKGVNKDPAKGLGWLNKAIDRNSPEAMQIMGSCYEKGVGVKQDSQKAKQWYERASRSKEAAFF